MSKLPIGIQLFSVRDFMEKDFASTLKELKKMGYQAVELAGLFNYTVKEVKNMCEEAGLIPISAHVDRGVIMADVKKVVGDYSEIGCKYIAIPWAPLDKNPPGSKGYDDFVKDVKIIAAECDKYGIKLLYHNHGFEFAKIDGKNILDILYEDTDPKVLQTQIDTCWAKVGGEDPAKYILKYTGRAPLIHIKDFVEDPFELRPIGYGIQDVLSIFYASENAGAEMVIVEQDHTSLDNDSLECAKLSIEYIRNIY